MLLSRFFFLLLLSSFFVASHRVVVAAAPPEMESVIVQKISARLNSFVSLWGRFEQVDPYGEITEGTFFLQRPGKLRFEYAPPHPILIVADGYWVGIENRQEKRTEKYPLSKTPLRVLLQPHFDITDPNYAVSWEEDPRAVSLSIEDRTGRIPGRLTLHFARPDLQLAGWTVLDAQGLTTIISLFDIVHDAFLGDHLFQINDYLLIEHDRKSLR